MNQHETYMRRCLQLAQLGAGNVAPNPMVGAVLVYNGRIIGEGYHQQYGGPHAEVNCINSVAESDRNLIGLSTIYVSLEPCAHFGKTPPCADLIIAHKIPKAVIGCRDPFAAVNGKGIEKLQQAGVEVTTGILENECIELNKRFFTFHTKKRPYIILKWAQSSDGKLASENNERTLISNGYSNRLVHKWRSEEAAIMVGTITALKDNPSLTTRLWKGSNPVRVLLDMNLRLPSSLQLLDSSVKTIVFNREKEEELQPNLLYVKLENEGSILEQVCKVLYQSNIQSVLVEGGAKLLQSFIDQNLFDEIRVIENTALHIGDGLAAPQFSNMVVKEHLKLMNDEIRMYEL
jgi:diaminohydroxyphosphoribosylaminopyrimidine deaminase / 5-amino-6-(5-phosphoribosylamino)uracil reductase